MIGFLYLNSEAYSTSTGIFKYFSKKYSITKPACQDVPQPIIIILLQLSNLFVYLLIPPSIIFSFFILPSIDCFKEKGCSIISFNM